MWIFLFQLEGVYMTKQKNPFLKSILCTVVNVILIELNI